MINLDRIVPVTATDLISLYSVIAGSSLGDSPLLKVDPATVDGVFEIVESITSGFAILSQPAKEIKVASAIQVAFIFVPDYDFIGVTVDGEVLPPAEESAVVEPDGCSLYRATYNGSTVTYAKVGF